MSHSHRIFPLIHGRDRDYGDSQNYYDGYSYPRHAPYDVSYHERRPADDERERRPKERRSIRDERGSSGRKRSRSPRSTDIRDSDKSNKVDRTSRQSSRKNHCTSESRSSVRKKSRSSAVEIDEYSSLSRLKDTVLRAEVSEDLADLGGSDGYGSFLSQAVEDKKEAHNVPIINSNEYDVIMDDLKDKPTVKKKMTDIQSQLHKLQRKTLVYVVTGKKELPPHPGKAVICEGLGVIEGSIWTPSTRLTDAGLLSLPGDELFPGCKPIVVQKGHGKAGTIFGQWGYTGFGGSRRFPSLSSPYAIKSRRSASNAAKESDGVPKKFSLREYRVRVGLDVPPTESEKKEVNGKAPSNESNEADTAKDVSVSNLSEKPPIKIRRSVAKEKEAPKKESGSAVRKLTPKKKSNAVIHVSSAKKEQAKHIQTSAEIVPNTSKHNTRDSKSRNTRKSVEKEKDQPSKTKGKQIVQLKASPKPIKNRVVNLKPVKVKKIYHPPGMSASIAYRLNVPFK